MDVNFSLDKIDAAAQNFVALAGQHKVFAFHGEMGAGKTTFINAVCKALAVNDVLSSPTFSIINEYRTNKGLIIYHMDLYRLKDEAEAIAAGVEDALFSENICFIEWPENAARLLPENTVHCYINTINNNERKLQINL
jgi:tRNA threonylcarbamoyladenosine biosynthesis protein TsaE